MVIKEKNALETVSKRFSELSEEKTTIESSYRETRKQSDSLKKENERLKANLQAKREREELARLAAIEVEVQETVAEVTPAPTPVQATSAPGDMESIVRQAARKYGLDENHFVSIGMCESGLNPNAVNTGYYENGHPSGMFQHLSGYWPARAAQYGYPGASVFDPVANANVTAAMFADGQSHQWECR